MDPEVKTMEELSARFTDVFETTRNSRDEILTPSKERLFDRMDTV
jgi:hypothetical protein